MGNSQNKDVDTKVVQMQFDGRQFNKDMQETANNIENFKKKLDFKGAAKGLEEVEQAGKKVRLQGLGDGIEAVRLKFSALDTMAFRTLERITDKALTAGKNFAKAFSTEPITSGLKEYETQINAIQTIQANTANKGTTMQQITSALNELNTYADKTIYNFTEMTRNIGTFTAAGVDLDKSVKAIQGIANLAAVSGSTSQQASTAMYQLSQALATGTVKLQDWNSVVNAGMGGQVFQNALIRTSELLGTGAEKAIKASGSFRDSLTKSGWLTTDVLTKTLEQFTMLDNEFNRAKLKSEGYSEQQISDILKMGQTATEAATKVKTFTQLIDTLKEAMQSGWTQSWELIFGNFEQAKAMFTEASDFFGDIIAKSSDSRNNLLRNTLTDMVSSEDWKKLKEAGIATKEFKQALIETAKTHGYAVDEMVAEAGSFSKTLSKGWLSLDILKETLENANTSIGSSSTEISGNLKDLENIAKEVINGKWGDGSERIDKLTKAGYKFSQVQKAVNALLKDGKIPAEELAKSSNENVKMTNKNSKSLEELKKIAEETGTPLNDLITKLERPTGRELLIDTVRNSIKAFIKVASSAKDAYGEIFPPMTSDKLYGIIDAIHSFSEKLVISDENANKFKTTMKGAFAVIDIFTSTIHSGIKFGLDVANGVLDEFGLNVLDVTSSIGEGAINLRDFIKSADFVGKAAKSASKFIVDGIKNIKAWIESLGPLPEVSVDIKSLETNAKSMFSTLKEKSSGIVPLLENFSKKIQELDGFSLSNIGKTFTIFKNEVIDPLLSKVPKLDDINETFSSIKISANGFGDGVSDGFSKAKDAIGNFVDVVKTKLSKIDFGALLAVGSGIAMIKFIKDISGALKKISGIAAPFQAVGNVLSEFGKKLKAEKMEAQASAMKEMAKAIAILAGAMLILSQIPKDSIGTSVLMLGTLMVFMTAFVKFNSKVGKMSSTLSSVGMIISMAIAISTMTGALKKLEKLDPSKTLKNVGIMTLIVTELTGFSVLTAKFSKDAGKSSLTLMGMAVAMRATVNVLKKLETIKPENVGRIMLMFTGIVTGMAFLSKSTTDSAKAGVGLLAMAVALQVVFKVMKKISSMDGEAIGKSLLAVAALFTGFGALVIASKFSGKYAKEAGVAILSMSASLLMISAACKTLDKLSSGGLKRAVSAISTITLIFAAFTAMTKFSGENSAKASLAILAMGGSLLMISGVMAILSNLDPAGLSRATLAVSIVTGMFALLVASTKNSKDCKSNLVIMASAIAVLTVSLGALSMVKADNLKSATLAITTVIGMFSLLIVASGYAKGSSKSLLVLASCVAALSGIVTALSIMNADASLQNAIALSTVLTALSAATFIVSKANSIKPSTLATLGILSASILLIGGICVAIQKMNISSETANTVLKISGVLLVLSGVCTVLKSVGVAALASVKGAAAIDAVILIIGGLLTAIGAVFNKVDGMEESLDKGIDILVKLGGGIGEFIGSFVGGIGVGLTDGLPAIGANIAEFGEQIGKFSDNISGINESTVDSALKMAEVIAILTAGEIMNGIGTFLGSKDLSGFSDDLDIFADAILSFSSKLGNASIDTKKIEDAATAGTALADFANTIPRTGGMIDNLLGVSDIEEFSKKIVAFGKAIVKFSKAITSEGVDNEAVKQAAIAGQALADFESALPAQGGKLQEWIGKKDIGEFGKRLKIFGTSLAQFSKAITSEGGIDPETIESAASVGKTLSELENSLPSSSGTLQQWLGKKDIADFGKRLVIFGNGIVNFSDTIKDKISAGSISSCASLGNMLATLENKLGKSKGIFDIFTGSERQIDDFGDDLASFGRSMVLFSEATEGVDQNKITELISMLDQIVSLSKKIEGLGTNALNDSLATVAQTGILSFTDTFDNSHANLDTAITNFMNTGVKVISEHIPEYRKAGVNAVEGFINGMRSKNSAVYDAAYEVGITALNASKKALDIPSPSKEMGSEHIPEYRKSGVNAVEGFVKGMKSKNSAVYDAGYEVGTTALNASNKALDIHSPSKKMGKVGKYAIDGFVNSLISGKKKISEVTKEVFSGFIEKAKASVSSGKYGKSLVDTYLGSYGAKSKDSTKNIKNATNALESFINKLYKESDIYKEDKATLKEHISNLKTLYAQKAELNKELIKANKESNSNKTSSSSQNNVKTIKNNIKEINKEIAAAKKQINKDNEEISDHASELLKELRKNISDTVKSYTNLFTVSTDTGINALERLDSSFSNIFTNIKNSLKSTLVDYGNIFNVSTDSGIDPFTKFDNSEEEKTNNIEAARTSLEEATTALAEAEQALAEAQAKSDSVNGRSLKYLDEVAEAKEKVAEATKAQIEAQEYLNEVQKDTDVSDMLEAMQSQLDGLDEWKKGMETLQSRGISKAFYEYLDELGTSGIDKIRTLVKMTDDEFKKANELYQETTKLGAENLIKGFADKLSDMKTWAKSMKQLAELDLSDEVKSALLEEFQNQGVSSSEYINTIISMTTDQLKQFNDTYVEYLKAPENIANDVTKLTEKYVKTEQTTIDQLIKEQLEGMQSNLESYEDWQNDISKLSKSMISKDLLENLTSLGIQGAEKVKAFANMTDAELKKANEMFAKTTKLTAQTVLDGFANKLADAKAWGDAVASISKLNLSTKVKEALLEEIQDQGPDSMNYIEAILGMSKKQLAEFDKKYKEYLKIPEQVADKVIAAEAKVNKESEDNALITKIEKQTEDAKETAELKGTELGQLVGTSIDNGVIKGVDDKSNKVKSTSGSMAKEAAKAIKKYLSESSGNSIGKNVDEGLTNGIRKHKQDVIDAINEVAVEALTSANNKLGIHSPSTEFEKVGMYSDKGFANGLLKHASNVKEAVSTVSSDALKLLKEEMHKLGEVDFDSIDLSPTITPVMDMSNVESSLKTITDTPIDMRIGNMSEIGYLTDRISGQNKTINERVVNNQFDQSTTWQPVNHFHIQGEDPKAIAKEVSFILGQQIKKKESVWKR